MTHRLSRLMKRRGSWNRVSGKVGGWASPMAAIHVLVATGWDCRNLLVASSTAYRVAGRSACTRFRRDSLCCTDRPTQRLGNA